MWSTCDVGGEPFGLQGEGPGAYVLHCDKGEWVPLMTAGEYVDIVQKKPVTIAPVPTRPTTTTTTVPVETGPVITQMSVGGGPANHVGSSRDSIHGIRFTGATQVLVDGISVVFSSAPGVEDTAIGIELPSLPAGSVDVTIVTPAGQYTLVDGYTYYDAPTIGTASAAVGDAGDQITAGGTGFDVRTYDFSRNQWRPNAQVRFETFDTNDELVDRFWIEPTNVSSTSLTFTVPASAGAVKATWQVYTLGGYAVGLQEWDYNPI